MMRVRDLLLDESIPRNSSGVTRGSVHATISFRQTSFTRWKMYNLYLARVPSRSSPYG